MVGTLSTLRPVDHIHAQELDRLRSMALGGITVAIPAALDYCREYKVPAPDWLLACSTELLCSLLKGEKPRRRGRASGHVARHRQDQIDYSRWSTVQWTRESQKELLHQVQVMNSFPNVPARYREDRERLLGWYGSTLDRAFECAAMMLEGTEAFGSPDTIKRSYFKVERNMADPDQAIRYHQLEPRFLAKVGIKWEPFVRPGRKPVPLYEVTM
jgi:hypothetical protein